MTLGVSNVIGKDLFLMFPMSRRKMFELKAFEGVLIYGMDLTVTVILCLNRYLESLEDMAQEIGLG